MSAETIIIPKKIINQIGNSKIDIIFDPLSFCTPDEIASLQKEIGTVIPNHFNGPGFVPDSLPASVFGMAGRGKILALARDLKSGDLNALVSGQILNDEGDPILFEESRVFHLSLIYSSGGSAIPLWNFLTREIHADVGNRVNYFSCFTQNPRVYLLLRHVSGAEIFPNHNPKFKSECLEEIHQQLTDFLGGTGAKNGVFKQKVRGSYTLERNYSKNPSVNDWFYDTLTMSPEKGDLLLLLARIKIPGD